MSCTRVIYWGSDVVDVGYPFVAALMDVATLFGDVHLLITPFGSLMLSLSFRRAWAAFFNCFPLCGRHRRGVFVLLAVAPAGWRPPTHPPLMYGPPGWSFIPLITVNLNVGPIDGTRAAAFRLLRRRRPIDGAWTDYRLQMKHLAFNRIKLADGGGGGGGGGGGMGKWADNLNFDKNSGSS